MHRLTLTLAVALAMFAVALLLDAAFAETVTEPGQVVAIRTVCPVASTCPVEQSRAHVCGWTIETADGSRYQVSAYPHDEPLAIGQAAAVVYERGWLTGWASGERLKR